ncbi:MAG: hypothetical protein ABEJ64_01200 [Candidatus Nanohaloarchaea archaeon]
MMRGNALMRPGTIFIVAVGLVIGLGVYNWSEQLFPSPEKNDSSRAIDCSTLDVNFLGQEDNGTHHTVFVQPSRRVSYAVVFEGSQDNFTRIVESSPAGEVTELTAPISPVQGVRAKVDGCSRVFRP